MPVSNVMRRVVVPVVLAAVIGGTGVDYWHRTRVTAAPATAVDGTPGGREDGDLAALRAEVAKLKANAPSQSHTMTDVGSHWTNLWFAVEKRNWPLAGWSRFTMCAP